MSMLDQLVERLTGPVQNRAVVRVFRLAVYGWALINTLMLLPVAADVWGPDAFIERSFLDGFYFLKIFNLLGHSGVNDWYWLFIAVQLGALVLAMLRIWPRLSGFVVWLITANLFYKAIALSHGGYWIMNLMLFFAIWMDDKPSSGPETRQSVTSNVVANLAFYGAQVQLAIMYAGTGLYKLGGELWLKGEALHYVFNIDAFSHPLVKEYVAASTVIVLLGTWFALFYQLLFPVLIWFRKFRPWVLLAGTALHLGIAFMMGLVDFGFAMIACYAIFYSENRCRRWLRWPPA